jgi:hypothetical protein
MIKHKILVSPDNREETKNLTPIKAIRWKCLECCNFSNLEVRLCKIDNCALHPFRHGKNPSIKREYTEEQKKAIAKRFKKANESMGEKL